MKTIEQELDLIQKQIEHTTEPMMRVHLFLKKIDLLKQQEQKIDYKKIIDQLEYDMAEDFHLIEENKDWND